MPLSSTSRSLPPWTFLSSCIAARAASGVTAPRASVRSPSRASKESTRAASAAGNQPARCDIPAAIASPTPTASPCNQGPNPVTCSMACPKVWPRLRSARSPVSRSSRETTPALMAQQRCTACASAAGSSASKASAFASSQAKKSASQISACFTTSARPARSSRGGSVTSVAVSASTASGWWKAPIRFLPPGWLTPVLPPTEESTCASSVVGTCRKPTPRW